MNQNYYLIWSFSTLWTIEIRTQETERMFSEKCFCVVLGFLMETLLEKLQHVDGEESEFECRDNQNQTLFSIFGSIRFQYKVENKIT